MEEIIKLCIKETIEILQKENPTYFDIRRAITLLSSASSIQQDNMSDNGE